MGGRMGWVGLFRSLGQALGELLQAELEALRRDVERSGKRFLLGVVLFAVAGALLFWMLGALTYSVIHFLTRWMPLWGAALSVAGGLALLAIVAVILGKWWWSRAESPVTTARRRVGDHVRWWMEQLPEADLPMHDDELPLHEEELP